MAAIANSAQEPDDRVLVITRLLDAPRALVFKAWTEPEHLVRWWGPRGFTMPSCRMEPQPGGTYRYCMRAADGTDHWVRGAYREVVPLERLVFTSAWEDGDGNPKHETVIAVTLAERGGKTELTLRQAVFESVTARDLHRGGWSEAMDMLAEHLATL